MGSLGLAIRRRITIRAHTKAQPTEPTPRRWDLSRMARRPKRPLRSTARAGNIGISQTRTFIVCALSATVLAEGRRPFPRYRQLLSVQPDGVALTTTLSSELRQPSA